MCRYAAQEAQLAHGLIVRKSGLDLLRKTWEDRKSIAAISLIGADDM